MKGQPQHAKQKTKKIQITLGQIVQEARKEGHWKDK
jgi:hypothetical protein